LPPLKKTETTERGAAKKVGGDRCNSLYMRQISRS